jgi:nicotinate-nucleotide adenylyltransferase
VRFYQLSGQNPDNLGILAGSFNPPTTAHRELVYAAGFHVDQVLCVLPKVFPHKDYSGATLEQRLEMLALAFSGLAAPYSIATSEQGLFLDIARECREHYGSKTRLYFLCGRDAAERVLTWDYGRPGAVEEMLREFELLVAARQGEFRIPAEFRGRIHPLGLRAGQDHVSSSEVRARIARGEPWEHLVPEAVVGRVREIYS